MPRMTILTEADLRKIVSLDLDAIACVEAAFEALATKAVAMPPILRLDIPEYRGEVDVKTAHVPGIDCFAIKISPGFFDNPKLGLPSVNGMMVLLNSRTGLVEALLLDNGYLTDVRTAAAGAVAAKHLSRPESSIAAIFGAGVQARLQLEALTLVRPIKQARIWARDIDKARQVAGQLTEKLGIAVIAAVDPEMAVRDADIIVTTTPSSEPILQASWLQPGQHVTAMGSDAEHKNELDPAIIVKADLYIADSLNQTRRLGELHHAIEVGLVKPDRVFSELGEVIAGLAKGRPSREAITLADLTGTGVQDTAIATLARDRARQSNAGTNFEKLIRARPKHEEIEHDRTKSEIHATGIRRKIEEDPRCHAEARH
jgi:ornithine cyclodeaminase